MFKNVSLRDMWVHVRCVDTRTHIYVLGRVRVRVRVIVLAGVCMHSHMCAHLC